MQKKVSVYVVKVGEISVPFTTRRAAEEAAELLAKFDLVAERVAGKDKEGAEIQVLPTEKRTVTIL